MEQFNNNNENEWSPSNPVYGTPVVKEEKKDDIPECVTRPIEKIRKNIRNIKEIM